jgi:hypothetical protein
MTAAKPGGYGSGHVRIVALRQARFVQTVKLGHCRKNPLGVLPCKLTGLRQWWNGAHQASSAIDR